MKIPTFPQAAIRSLCILGVVLLAGSLVPAKAHADSGQAFSISPPLIELRADPGQTVNATIKFTNISSGKLLIKTEFNDFGAKDENGDPNIILDTTETTPYSLKNWIAAPAPFLVQSKETKTLNFPISVPKNAEPGGHYAVIRFTGTAPGADQNGVSLSASIGSLVLLQVSGNIQEEAQVAEFFSATPQFASNNFFESSPVGFVERIKNSGNVHVKPTGTIDIYNMFGQKVTSLRVNGDPTDPNNQPKSILPQSIRRFEETTPNNVGMFGMYTAKLNLSYGQGQKQLTSSVTFWVIPYNLILLILVGIVVLFFVGRFALKRYKENIIAKAQGRSLKRRR